MVMVSSGQLVVPKEGWKLIAKGHEEVDGKKFLGAWQTEDESVTVGIGWADELPKLSILLGVGGDSDSGVIGSDPSMWPEKAVLLKEPKLGLKIKFKDTAKQKGAEHYWIWSEHGGFLINVFFSGQEPFSLDAWGFGKNPEDRYGEIKEELQAIEKLIKNPLDFLQIKIDTEVNPPIARNNINAKDDKNFAKIRVVVTADGKYFMGGVEQSEESLVKAFEKAKNENEEVVLHIAASRKVEFKHCQYIIKLGGAAGIQQLAYAALEENEGKEESK